MVANVHGLISSVIGARLSRAIAAVCLPVREFKAAFAILTFRRQIGT